MPITHYYVQMLSSLSLHLKTHVLHLEPFYERSNLHLLFPITMSLLQLQPVPFDTHDTWNVFALRSV